MNRLRSAPLPVQLRDALNSGLDALPDAELLDRFARYADHPAFEVIVRRHGPMVFGVCRRMIGNSADADDAFQAAFLVLIRKARSLRRGDRLGPWLYGVACRVALKARSQAARRAAFRTEATDMIPDPAEPVEIPDWLPILDAELAALPAKYRDPLVLCELQGATRADAAKSLGVPEGTLSSRLARGRDLLRKRLLKHGTLLPAGGLPALFATNGVGRATVPLSLLSRTSELAKVATGAAPAGAVPVGAARLTDEVLKGMFLTKLRLASVPLALVALAVGLSTAALPSDAPDAQPDKGAAKAPVAKAPERKMPTPTAPGLSVVEFADKGTVLPDAKTVQGWWRLKQLQQTQESDLERAAHKHYEGNLLYFIAGNVWWEISNYGDEQRRYVRPWVATLQQDKNPKWLDLAKWDLDGTGDRPHKHIYHLDAAEELTVVSANETAKRPAEFDPNDKETRLYSFLYRRTAPPASAGVPALVGSWEQSVKEFRVIGSNTQQVGNGGVLMTARVEIYDGVLFLNNPTAYDQHWIGGYYTVNTSRNPPGIDIQLFHPLPQGVAKLYGSYKVTRDKLKLVLGLTGKQAERPMDFVADASNGAPDRLYFELSRAALRPGEKPELAPAPKEKGSATP